MHRWERGGELVLTGGSSARSNGERRVGAADARVEAGAHVCGDCVCVCVLMVDTIVCTEVSSCLLPLASLVALAPASLASCVREQCLL